MMKNKNLAEIYNYKIIRLKSKINKINNVRYFKGIHWL